MTAARELVAAKVAKVARVVKVAKVAKVPPAEPNAKSFLRWVGSKRSTVHELMARVPESFVGYHEVFIGSGALFWALANAGRLRKAQVALSDTCDPLVRTWRALKTNHEDVIAALGPLGTYRVTEEHYYAVRSKSAEDLAAMSDVELAAWFLFINKTNFNGVHRVNRSGVYNVPYGRWTEKRTPNICDAENLAACGEVLQRLRVALNTRPFESVLHYAKPGDFVYMDSPYLPTSATADFTSYTAEGFGYDDHVRLRDVARELKERGVHVMLSNADVPLVRELYESWRGFQIDVIGAPRAVNSDATKRGKVRELVIR